MCLGSAVAIEKCPKLTLIVIKAMAERGDSTAYVLGLTSLTLEFINNILGITI